MLGGRQMGLLILHKINCNGHCYLLNLSMNSSVLKFVLLVSWSGTWAEFCIVNWSWFYQLSKICIVGWHLEIREANTITDVIEKSTSWLRGAFFHRLKKKNDNSFLISSKTITNSLPFPCRKKPTAVFFFFVFFLWATACKEGHRRSPKRSSFTGNVLLGENDQSISFKGSLFDVEPKKEGVWFWHRDEQDWQQILMTHDRHHFFF